MLPGPFRRPVHHLHLPRAFVLYRKIACACFKLGRYRDGISCVAGHTDFQRGRLPQRIFHLRHTSSRVGAYKLILNPLGLSFGLARIRHSKSPLHTSRRTSTSAASSSFTALPIAISSCSSSVKSVPPPGTSPRGEYLCLVLAMDASAFLCAGR